MLRRILILLLLSFAPGATAAWADANPPTFGGITGFSWDVGRVPSGPVTAPEWALYHMQRALWDPVDPHQLGSLSAALQYRVNGEVYRFSSERTLKKFIRTPERWCGLVRDPITGRTFKPSTHTPEAYWVGGPYFFESDSTKQQFIDDPHRYEIIRAI